MGKSKSRGKIPRIHYSKDRVKRVFYLINAYPKKEKSNIRGDGDYGLGGCPSTTIKSTPHKKCLLTIIKKLKAILTFLDINIIIHCQKPIRSHFYFEVRLTMGFQR